MVFSKYRYIRKYVSENLFPFSYNCECFEIKIEIKMTCFSSQEILLNCAPLHGVIQV